MNKEEIKKLKEHCEKQASLSYALNDVKHYKEHLLILEVLDENERLKEIVDKTNNELITLIQIIMEQPSNNVEEDNYLLNRLEGISSILTGGN